ncbi:MAG: DUF1971 domain-containing protein [Proteobacteria bacterium]|nr:DUF1971 domain-containing protein [Pseudomonadota bacterium]MBS0550374.1 DUF1971 domain-containing protein [Pseudomonadota bacterium]
MLTPYKTTEVFDENTLPAALRREHRTKAGVWGVIRVSKGEVRLFLADGNDAMVLTPDRPGLVLPEQTHYVEPLGEVRMWVEFYNSRPIEFSR